MIDGITGMHFMDLSQGQLMPLHGLLLVGRKMRVAGAQWGYDCIVQYVIGFLSFRTVEDFRRLRFQMVFYLVGEHNYPPRGHVNTSFKYVERARYSKPFAFHKKHAILPTSHHLPIQHARRLANFLSFVIPNKIQSLT